MLVEKELNKFGKRVVKEAKTALTKKKKNASKELYNSIGYTLNVSKNSFSLSFEMEDYGKFIDEGVKGSESSAKAPRSQFKYKKGIKNKPSYKHFVQWVARKGLSGTRDKKGRFVSRKGLAIAVSYGVWRKGLETTDFFRNPFESAFKSLPDELVEAYGLDIEKFLENTLA